MEINYKSSPLLYFSQSTELDRFTIEEKKISGLLLMGMAVSSIYKKYRKLIKDSKIIILSGSGNNGGDGLGFGYLCKSEGMDVEIYYKQGNHSEEFNFYLNLCNSQNIEISGLNNFPRREKEYHKGKIFIIDAILGTGFRLPLKEDITNIINSINSLKEKNKNLRIISIDTISGFSPGNLGVSIKTDYLAEIGCKKIENQFVTHLIKKKTFHPIGFNIREFISIQNVNQNHKEVKLLNSKLLKNFTKRKEVSHKFQNGVCAFIGGSKGMSGSILLSLDIFHGMGGGYSTLFSPSKNTRKLVLQENPSYISKPLNSKLLEDNFWNKCNTLVIGPGLNPKDIPQQIDFLLETNKYMVLDAGSIDYFKEKPLNHKMLFTPHEGEFSRLIKSKWTGEIDKIQKLVNFCISQKTNVLLKGHVSILGTYKGEFYYFNSPNSNLAVMGTGDLLSGILGYFLSKTQNVVTSVILGLSYFHQSKKINFGYPNTNQIRKYLKRKA